MCVMAEPLCRVHLTLVDCQADKNKNQFLQALDSFISNDDTETGTGENSQIEGSPVGGPSGLPWRSGRTIHPTWKVIESRLEPPTMHLEAPPTPDRRVVLIRETFHGARNVFGLARVYKGIPSSIPDQPGSNTYIPLYCHPVPPQESKTIEEIIFPYPNLSSFLFDHHFWTSGPTKSQRDRDSTQELLT